VDKRSFAHTLIYIDIPFEIVFDLVYGYQQAFTGSIVEHDDNLSAIQPPKNNDSEKVSSVFSIF
jgi:hypothetical protein